MANHPLEGLLAFSLRNHLIGRQDLPFCRNLLLDVLGLDAPQEPYRPYEAEPVELPVAPQQEQTQHDQPKTDQIFLFHHVTSLCPTERRAG